MKCGTENAKKLIFTKGVGSVLKHGSLLKELKHQEKKFYTNKLYQPIDGCNITRTYLQKID